MKIINIFRYFIVLMAVMLLTSQASAFDPDGSFENLILFDSDGQVTGTRHVDDFTKKVEESGSVFNVSSEIYPADVTQPPTIKTTPFAVGTDEKAVPNNLSATYPAPPSGIPPVSLFSFDDATLTGTKTPGISFSPSSGTYAETIAVTIQAFPSTAKVQYRAPGSAFWLVGGNIVTLYVYKTKSLEIRAERLGFFSTIYTADYIIDRSDGIHPEMADTDNDGYPDGWEISKGLNPLSNDTETDTDKDGISDIDEIIRGSDPDDVTDLPVDSDGDGWSKFDEDLRGTSDGNIEDRPVARRLYEVERKLSGAFYKDNAQTTPAAEMAYGILSFDSIPFDLGNPKTDGSGKYGTHRIPVGETSLIRLAGEEGSPDENWVLKRYIPISHDVSPKDITDNWETAAEWEALYNNLLADKLVETVTGFNITPSHSYPLAILEREYEILEGLPDGIFLLLGSPTHIPESATLVLMEGLLGTKGLGLLETPLNADAQDMNDHMEDINSLLKQAGLHTTLITQSDAIFTGLAGASDTSEVRLAELYQADPGRYLAGLILAFKYESLNESGDPTDWNKLLDPDQDMDGDSLFNDQEVPTPEQPSGHSDIFTDDSDGDGIKDDVDNCPAVYNPGQSDWDSDGLGDACDTDDDDDGLTDGVEMAFGSNPFDKDTNDDGENDYEEWVNYEKPGVLVTIQVVSPTILAAQTVSGKREAGYSISLAVDTGASAGTVSYPVADEWQATITGLALGDNNITVTAGSGEGSAYATIYRAEGSVLPGDVNNKDGVTLQDAILILQVLAGITPGEPITLEADVDGDDKIGIPDLIYVLQTIAAL